MLVLCSRHVGPIVNMRTKCVSLRFLLRNSWSSIVVFIILAPLVMTFVAPPFARADETFTAKEIESILLSTKGTLPYVPASDRERWLEVRKQLGQDRVNDLLERAAQAAHEPLPVLPASLYLQFERTGERAPYERMVADRFRRLSALTLAECLEYEGRFADALLDLCWAICEQSTWVYPAHRDGLPEPIWDTIDLFSAIMGMELGIAVQLVGDTLDPRLVRRIKYEADRRLFTPYLEDDFGWRRRRSNWNAVCNGSVMTAAVLLEEDTARLARILAIGLESLQLFLDGFSAEGGTSEGVSYWQFGFGHYTLVGHVLEQRTEGKIDLFADPHIKEIALFPYRCELSPGRYVTFSDAGSGALTVSWIPYFLSERLNLPQLRALAGRNPFHERFSRGSLTYLPLTWLELMPGDEEAPPYEQEIRHLFPDLGWFIYRADPDNPNGLVLAAKAGHNAEMHNHNDVGSFIVHLAGESILTDPGAGVYSRQYFGKERYTFFATSSRGHPVPVINGYYQRSGAEARGTVIERTESQAEDLLVIDLTDAYPGEAGVEKLTRSFRFYRRGSGEIELRDEALFEQDAGTLECTLITKGEVSEVRPGLLRIQGESAGVEVSIEPRDAKVTLDRKSAAELLMRNSEGFITRVSIGVAGGQAGESVSTRLLIRPAQ